MGLLNWAKKQVRKVRVKYFSDEKTREAHAIVDEALERSREENGGSKWAGDGFRKDKGPAVHLSENARETLVSEILGNLKHVKKHRDEITSKLGEALKDKNNQVVRTEQVVSGASETVDIYRGQDGGITHRTMGGKEGFKAFAQKHVSPRAQRMANSLTKGFSVSRGNLSTPETSSRRPSKRRGASIGG